MTTYNQSGFLYNQAGAIYNQSAIERTATGSGQGTQTAVANFFSIIPRTATGSGTGTSNNSIKLGLLRTGYGSGGATAGDTATGLHIAPRTATATGTGSGAATGSHIAPRTASNTGTGTSTVTGLHIAPRTATGSGTGTGELIGARTLIRSATNTGLGTATADWVKSHIFRVPYTETYPAGYFGGGDAANRLRRYDRSNIRALNLYKLTDGTYTTVEQRDLGQVVKLWHGGRDHFLTDAEVVELTEAGFGASIS